MAEKHKGEINIESWSTPEGSAPATAADLKPPPVIDEAGPHVKVFDGASGAAGGEHEIEYDILAGNAAGPDDDAEAMGSANGGVWKTTNFATDSEGASERSAPSISEIVVTKNSDSSMVIDGFLKVHDVDGDSAAGGGKMHLEDISAAPGEPEPGVEIFLKLPDVNGEADDASGSAHGAGGGGGGAGKVAVHDISIMDEDDGPSSFAALEPDRDPGPYLEYRLQSVKVTSYSVNGSGLDASDDGPSSMATLSTDDAAERSGEEPYLTIKLENVQITSYSLDHDQTPGDFAGGTEHEDSWEDAL